MKRTIYIIGEDHLKRDESDQKLDTLGQSIVFDEHHTSMKRGSANLSTVPTPLVYGKLEKLFWLLYHVARIKEEVTEKTVEMIPMLVADIFDDTMSIEEIAPQLPKFVVRCKKEIIASCTEIGPNEQTDTIMAYITPLKFSTLVVDSAFSTAFYATYVLVDKAIVSNIQREDEKQDPHLPFVVILGEDHVPSIRKLLKDFNVYMYNAKGKRKRTRRKRRVTY